MLAFWSRCRRAERKWGRSCSDEQGTRLELPFSLRTSPLFSPPALPPPPPPNFLAEEFGAAARLGSKLAALGIGQPTSSNFHAFVLACSRRPRHDCRSLARNIRIMASAKPAMWSIDCSRRSIDHVFFSDCSPPLGDAGDAYPGRQCSCYSCLTRLYCGWARMRSQRIVVIHSSRSIIAWVGWYRVL